MDIIIFEIYVEVLTEVLIPGKDIANRFILIPIMVGN